jgi:hypothetical protein
MVSMLQSKDIEWETGENQDLVCCLEKAHLNDKKEHWLWMKGRKNIFQENELSIQREVIILISDKVYFKIKSIRRIKEGNSY